MSAATTTARSTMLRTIKAEIHAFLVVGVLLSMAFPLPRWFYAAELTALLAAIAAALWNWRLQRRRRLAPLQLAHAQLAADAADGEPVPADADESHQLPRVVEVKASHGR